MFLLNPKPGKKQIFLPVLAVFADGIPNTEKNRSDADFKSEIRNQIWSETDPKAKTETDTAFFPKSETDPSLFYVPPPLLCPNFQPNYPSSLKRG